MSMNVNGVRSAVRKGLWDFVAEHDPDVVCLQEVRAADRDLPAPPDGYRGIWLAGERRGYSGVGVLTRIDPVHVATGLGVPGYDREGRVLRLDLPGLDPDLGPGGLIGSSTEGATAASTPTTTGGPHGPVDATPDPASSGQRASFPVTLVNVYVPSGTTGEPRQSFKMRFLKRFKRSVKALLREGRDLIIVGDINIAHSQVDLKNWRSNQKTSGFLPEERAFLDGLLALGLHDTVRELIGPDTALYSWWSARGGARERDVGWRLDYHFTTPAVHRRASSVLVPREPLLSDHAPVIVEY